MTNDERSHTIIDDVDSVMGILHEYADTDLISLEKNAWAEAAAEKEQRFLKEHEIEKMRK